MKATIVVLLLSAAACGGDAMRDAGPSACDLDARVELTAQAGALQSDGSVTIYGSVRFEPLIGSGADTVVFERSVHAVYVADLEAQPGTNDFNFRTWSVSITGDRLLAFASVGSNGDKRAVLPVTAFLQGNCAVSLPTNEEPSIDLDSGSGSGAGAGSGSGI